MDHRIASAGITHIKIYICRDRSKTKWIKSIWGHLRLSFPGQDKAKQLCHPCASPFFQISAIICRNRAKHSRKSRVFSSKGSFLWGMKNPIFKTDDPRYPRFFTEVLHWLSLSNFASIYRWGHRRNYWVLSVALEFQRMTKVPARAHQSFECD